MRWECSLGPEYADIDMKQILRRATREGRNIFKVFKVKEEGEHHVASGDGRIVKDTGYGKRKKLGRKVEKLKWKISESGVSHLKMQPKEC